MNKLVELDILSGLPGSGKSQFAAWLMQQALSKKKTAITINSDEIRFAITGHYNNFEHENHVWSEYFTRIMIAKTKYDVVICDACNLLPYQWNKYAEIGAGIIVIYRVNTDFNTCCDRVANRPLNRRIARATMHNYQYKMTQYNNRFLHDWCIQHNIELFDVKPSLLAPNVYRLEPIHTVTRAPLRRKKYKADMANQVD